MTFSMYSMVRTLISPVFGQTNSSVRRVMRSFNNFSFSLTANIWPGFVRNAIRGRGHFYNYVKPILTITPQVRTQQMPAKLYVVLISNTQDDRKDNTCTMGLAKVEQYNTLLIGALLRPGHN